MNGNKLPCEAKTDHLTPAQKFASTLAVLKACGKDEFGRLKPSIIRMWADPDEAEKVRELGDQIDAGVYEKREKTQDVQAGFGDRCGDALGGGQETQGDGCGDGEGLRRCADAGGG